MKELKIEVPKGYEIDKEHSTFECIKFKPKGIKTWNDLCVASLNSDEVRVKGYWISGYSSDIYAANKLMPGDCSKNVFLTEKEAKSSLAMSQISQLMPYYGGAITDEDWANEELRKFIIDRYCNRVLFDVTYTFYEYLAFYTKEQRDNFYKNNEQLVKDFLMID